MSNRVYFNHLGQTITDIARSRRFYEDLLGFKFWWDFEVPDELSCKVLMVPSPCKLTATYLWRPDLVLNLMHFGDPGAQEVYEARSSTRPGLTHLALSVEDVPALLDKVRSTAARSSGRARVRRATGARRCTSVTPTVS